LHFKEYRKNGIFEIEKIQDAIEMALMQLEPGVAKRFIVYREKRKNIRESNGFDVSSIISNYLDESDWRVKENANVNYSLGGLILHNSGSMSSNYWLNEIYTEKIRNAHINGDLHIHDLNMLSGYCSGWSLSKLISEGIHGVGNKLASAPAKHFSTLVNHMVNFLGILQNEWSGAQAFSSVDTYLAPFVRYDKLNYDEVKQEMQSLIYALNTPSRWGCVLPDTEVLTPKGWETFDTLEKDQDIYCWHNGELVVGKVLGVCVKDYDGDIISFVNDHYGYEQEVTIDHRCLSSGYSSNKLTPDGEIVLAKDIKKYHRLPTLIKANLPDNPNFNDAEIELAARIYCDGSICFRNLPTVGKRLHKITYYKSTKREDVSKISELFDSLNLKYSHQIRQKGFGEISEWTFYSDSARKILDFIESRCDISEKFLTLGSRQSKLFIDTWMRFNCMEETARLQYDTDQIFNKLQHIALRAGYTSFNKEKTKLSYLSKSGKEGTTRYIKIRQIDTVTYKQKKVEKYIGTVWCPSTTYGTAIFRKNGNVFISGQSQSPFTNFTFDLKCPEDLRYQPVIIGGQPWEEYTYGEFQAEMDMINKAFIELMYGGDAKGRIFSYPIPTYNLTKDFDWESEVAMELFKLTGKYGTGYFQNFINSDLEPSDVRSMCPLTGDTEVIIRTADHQGVRNETLINLYNNYQEKEFEVLYGDCKWHKAIATIQPATEIYDITVEDGTIITMGENHLQPCRRKFGTGEIRDTVKAKQLIVGDELPFSSHVLCIKERMKVTRENLEYMEVYQEITHIVKKSNNKPLYCLEVYNNNHLFTLSNGLITHNCRLGLRLDLLQKRGGGLFGAADQTGSMGVVTLNLPRIGYKVAKCFEEHYKPNSEDRYDEEIVPELSKKFKELLKEQMDIARDSLILKKKTIKQFSAQGMYPYTSKYLPHWEYHYLTIGVIGMNEAMENLFGYNIVAPECRKFALDIMDYINKVAIEYQELSEIKDDKGKVIAFDMFNIESTPGEGTTMRLAKLDKKLYPDIKTAGNEEGYYYTNSTQLPVNYDPDIFTCLDQQDEFQCKYTGGTVFHGFIGEQISDPVVVSKLVKSIAYKYKLPYFTITPSFSVCDKCGYLPGEVWKCPNCERETEVYSRIVGYYQPLKGWNKAKRSEYKDRVEFNVEKKRVEEELDNCMVLVHGKYMPYKEAYSV
jgi:anaerobic ribonucleoside-triphosphate reductase